MSKRFKRLAPSLFLSRPKVKLLLLLYMTSFLGLSSKAYALRANKVWFEYHPVFFRVYIEYTLPNIRELRSAYAEFRSFQKAKDFYWKVVQGGEFFLDDPQIVRYPPTTNEADPW